MFFCARRLAALGKFTITSSNIGVANNCDFNCSLIKSGPCLNMPRARYSIVRTAIAIDPPDTPARFLSPPLGGGDGARRRARLRARPAGVGDVRLRPGVPRVPADEADQRGARLLQGGAVRSARGENGTNSGSVPARPCPYCLAPCPNSLVPCQICAPCFHRPATKLCLDLVSFACWMVFEKP